MRLILLLAALAIVALLVKEQLDSTSPPISSVESGISDPKAPQIPTAPEGVKDFGNQMDSYLQNTADQRAKQLKEQLEKQ